jgi:ABC-type antimicrobial peptide transport system permease subunit
MNLAWIVAGASVVFVISLVVIAFVLGTVAGRQRAFRASIQSRVRDVGDGKL